MSVTLCAVVRFTCFYLHKVPEGLPSYILRTGSGRTDGRDVYGVIRCVPFIVVFGVGTQRPRRPVITRRPNTRAGGECYLFPSKLVVCQGRVTLPRTSLRGVRAPNTSSTLRSVPPEYSMSIIQSIFHLEVHIVRVKTTSVYLSTDGKPLVCDSTSPGPGISGFPL